MAKVRTARLDTGTAVAAFCFCMMVALGAAVGGYILWGESLAKTATSVWIFSMVIIIGGLGIASGSDAVKNIIDGIEPPA